MLSIFDRRCPGCRAAAQTTATTTYTAPAPAPNRPWFLTLVLCSLSALSTAFLIMGIIVVAAAGNGPDEYYFEQIWISWRNRIGMVFVWTPIPALALLANLLALTFSRKWTPKRGTVFLGINTLLFGFAAILWSTCSFVGFGRGTVCWGGGWTFYARNHDPMVLRYILPFIAGATHVVYMALTAYTFVLHRRRRNIPSMSTAYAKSTELDAENRASFETSEFAASSIGEQTLPSLPRSTVPSRQLSQANRPPTYYSSGDESLLTVGEKNEK